MTIAQSLFFPPNIHEFRDAVSSFLMAWSCSVTPVGGLYPSLNGALLLPVVSSFCESYQLGEEAEGASSTASYSCRNILVGGDM